MFFSLEDALRVHQSQGWRYETGIVIVLKITLKLPSVHSSVKETWN